MENKKRCVKFFLVNCVVILTMLVSMSFSVFAEESEEDVTIRPISFLFMMKKDSIMKFSGEQLQSLAKGELVEPTLTYTELKTADSEMNLIDIKSGKSMAFMFITKDAIQALASDGLSIISNWVTGGVLISCLGQDGDFLKEALGFGGSRAVISSDELLGGVSDLFVLYASSKTVFREINFPIDNLGLDKIMDNIVQWFLETKSELAAEENRAGDAWESHYTKEWKGSYSTSNSGTYRFLINVQKLIDNSSTKDWYLVSTSLTSSIHGYDCANLSTCGPYTTKVDYKVALLSGASLYDYMPTGTVGGGSKGFSIGGGLDGSVASDSVGVGGNFSASYSESYDFTDVTLTDKTDFVSNTVNWECRLRGPDYTWYPFITPASGVSANSYTWKPSFIAEVKEGASLQLQIDPTIEQVKDTIYFYVFWADISRSSSSWSNPFTITIDPPVTKSSKPVVKGVFPLL
ncbi:MAG: hypothetical protein HQK72_15945 [Desulfamplus sp.]|nr:hypothetical protein [Desulfamplus sp.]